MLFAFRRKPMRSLISLATASRPRISLFSFKLYIIYIKEEYHLIISYDWSRYVYV